MEKLRQIVEETNTRSGLVFDLCIQVLILSSIVIFSLETLPSLAPTTIAIFVGMEMFFVTIFSLEYLVRILVAKEKTKFIFSFWGVIDRKRSINPI